jgi:hypothetical protein
MRLFPIWKFAMFAFFDASAAFLYAIGAPNTPATLQNVFVQVSIFSLHFLFACDLLFVYVCVCV